MEIYENRVPQEETQDTFSSTVQSRALHIRITAVSQTTDDL